MEGVVKLVLEPSKVPPVNALYHLKPVLPVPVADSVTVPVLQRLPGVVPDTVGFKMVTSTGVLKLLSLLLVHLALIRNQVFAVRFAVV